MNSKMARNDDPIVRRILKRQREPADPNRKFLNLVAARIDKDDQNCVEITISEELVAWMSCEFIEFRRINPTNRISISYK